MGDVVKATIEQLNQKNYFDWSRRISAALIYKKWWTRHVGIGAGPPKLPEGQPVSEEMRAAFEESVIAWEDQDMQVAAWIKLHVDPYHIALVENAKSAKELWDKFAQLYAPKGLQAQMSILTDFLAIYMGPNENLGSYLGKLQTTRERMYKAGGASKLPQELFTLQMLRGLPDDWSSTVQIVNGWDDDKISEENVEKLLVAEENRRQAKQGSGARSAEGALFGAPKSSGQKPVVRTGPFKGKCFNLGKEGHMARNCRLPNKKNNGQAR